MSSNKCKTCVFFRKESKTDRGVCLDPSKIVKNIDNMPVKADLLEVWIDENCINHKPHTDAMSYTQARSVLIKHPMRREAWEKCHYVQINDKNQLVCDQGYDAEYILTDEDKKANDWIISTDEDYYAGGGL